MQQQPYGNYPYYPMYAHTPYMGANNPPGANNTGYPPFYGPPLSQQPPPAPYTNNPPAPSPYSYDAAAYNLKPNNRSESTGSTTAATAAQSRAYRRNSANPVPAPNASAPLKSAMKKTMNALSHAEVSIGRQFSNSNPFHNPAANNNTNAPSSVNPNPNIQMPRPRVYSNPSNPLNLRDDQYEKDMQEPIAYHMLVSFHGYNELRIEHVMRKALEDLRSIIWPIWKDGIESDNVQNNTCIVKFKNNPWDMGGPNSRQAYRLITAFFSLFQDKGYSFQTAINMTTATPRLIFQVTQPDPRAHFFIAYFDHDGARFTIIEPPTILDLFLVSRLRETLPHKINYDKPVEANTRVIEVKKKLNNNGPEVEQSVLLVEILKILNLQGYQLDASLTFGRKGTLGMRSTRELLIFKGHL